MTWNTVIGLAGLCLFLYWCHRAIPLWMAMLRPRHLRSVSGTLDAPHSPCPSVSVIVPACNEAGQIRACLESLIAQDAADFEIIAVDDRSTDSTGRIMDDLAAAHARLRVLHVLELPSGWLGKNHANFTATAQARGDWLLFTDGDVLFEASVIRRALDYVAIEQIDHLCLLPGLVCHGFLEKAACCFFGLLFSSAFRVEHVRNPLRPGSFCGVGAFNLVRAEAYRAIGGHARLRMEVADDVKLGKLLKHSGFTSDMLAGWPDVRVRWQQGLRGVIRGLEKNGFAGVEYRASRAIFGVLMLILIGVAPLAGVFLAPGWGRWGFGLWLAAEVATLAAAARQQGYSWTVGLACPLACLALAWAIGRSTILTLYRGGVRWRDTFYPLAELRRGMV